jgi:hypothetical protein
MVMVMERGNFAVAGTGKLYKQEYLCMKDRSVLPGINHLKNTSGHVF